MALPNESRRGEMFIEESYLNLIQLRRSGMNLRGTPHHPLWKLANQHPGYRSMRHTPVTDTISIDTIYSLGILLR